MKRYLSILLAIIVAIWPFKALGQSEIPVLVKPPTAAKVLALIDDSGSMNAAVEHPEFSPTDACVIDSSHTIPGVIFKLEANG